MTEEISRRTVAKAAAWAVPVIAVAATIPAAAASVPLCSVVSATRGGQMTTTSMVLTLSFLTGTDPVAAGNILRVVGITGASFTTVNGVVPSQTTPLDIPITSSPLQLLLGRSGDVAESGQVSITAIVLARDLQPCDSLPTTFHIDYVYPSSNPNVVVTLTPRCAGVVSGQDIAFFDIRAENLNAGDRVLVTLSGPIQTISVVTGPLRRTDDPLVYELYGNGDAQLSVIAQSLTGQGTAVLQADIAGHTATVTLTRSGNTYTCTPA